jgi:hypothetical protein
MGFSEFSEIRPCTRWETILLKLFLQPVSLCLDQFFGGQIKTTKRQGEKAVVHPVDTDQ